MLSISKPQQWLIAAVLMLLMIMTRGHHFASVSFLPSASWAIFFLAGFYLSRTFWFPVLLLLAAGLDQLAIAGNSANAFCVSPAYGFLLPAYGSLWLAGRWFAGKYQFALSTLMPFVFSVVVAAAAATLFSNGGFYWFSGQYTNPSLSEYLPRFLQYFPKYLANLSFYLVIAAIVHSIFSLRISAKQDRINQSH